MLSNAIKCYHCLHVDISFPFCKIVYNIIIISVLLDCRSKSWQNLEEMPSRLLSLFCLMKRTTERMSQNFDDKNSFLSVKSLKCSNVEIQDVWSQQITRCKRISVTNEWTTRNLLTSEFLNTHHVSMSLTSEELDKEVWIACDVALIPGLGDQRCSCPVRLYP